MRFWSFLKNEKFSAYKFYCIEFEIQLKFPALLYSFLKKNSLIRSCEIPPRPENPRNSEIAPLSRENHNLPRKLMP